MTTYGSIPLCRTWFLKGTQKIPAAARHYWLRSKFWISTVSMSWLTNVQKLSSKAVLDMESTLDEHISNYLRTLDGKIDSTSSRAIRVNLSQDIPHLTLDIITNLCLGESFRCVENEKDQYGFLDTPKRSMVYHQYISVLLERTKLLLYIGKVSFFRSLLFPNANSSDGIGRVMLVSFKHLEPLREMSLLNSDQVTRKTVE